MIISDSDLDKTNHCFYQVANDHDSDLDRTNHCFYQVANDH